MLELANTYKSEMLSVDVYKMTTPVKRTIMVTEDIPQIIIVALVSNLRYTLRAAPRSVLMMIGKVAIPIYRLIFAYAAYPYLRPLVAGWQVAEEGCSQRRPAAGLLDEFVLSNMKLR